MPILSGQENKVVGKKYNFYVKSSSKDCLKQSVILVETCFRDYCKKNTMVKI
jgi:hypothetical protein